MPENSSSLIQVEENKIYILSSVEVNEEASYVSVTEPVQSASEIIEVMSLTSLEIFEGQSVPDSTIARKYSETIGDGINSSFIITHNLNTRDCVVSIHPNEAPYEEVSPSIQKTNLNALTISFVDAVPTGKYRVTVIG